MGHVKTDKLDNGNIGLEITYGGLESPFMGLHTGPPPAYVDPRCLVASDGFIVVDNSLVLISVTLDNLPVLWNGTHAIPIKFGNFYDSVFGYLNYGLGYIATLHGGAPFNFEYVFYLTVWDTQNNIVDNQILDLKLFSVNNQAVASTLTIPVALGETSGFADTGYIGISYGASGVLVGTVTFGYAPGTTQNQAVVGLAAAITAASASTLFTAVASTDGFSIVLTAVTPGAAGNNLQIMDDSASNTAGVPPAYYIPVSGINWVSLTGGSNGQVVSSPASFNSVSATAVAGVLYFANLGPFILKYSKSSITPGLQISSLYQGVRVIKKFAGSLIGLGVYPALGTILQNSNMIFAWSAANNLDEWAPVTSAGFVTGAGFAGLADIDDQLIGLIVSNNTAFIIRSQGVSYATALGSGTDPFQFAHISLGDNGEGCQNPELVAQYGETGAFVGNADVFRVAGNLQPIGQRIKSLLFTQLTDTASPLGSVIYPVILGGDKFPFLLILVGNYIFTYHTENQTWGVTTVTYILNALSSFMAVFARTTGGSPDRVEFNTSLIQYATAPIYQVTAYTLQEGISHNGFAISNSSSLTFPQEELLLGRDVTIDALYISLNALVTGTVSLKFSFNGVLFSTIVLDPAVFNSLNKNPTELQIFPTSGAPLTVHSPQLTITMDSTFGATAKIEYAKIQEYGSFDPAQRPV